MRTAVVYCRVPAEIKEQMIRIAKSEGKQQSEVLIKLVRNGLLYPSLSSELSQLQTKLSEVEKANQILKSQLEQTKSELELARQNLTSAQRAKGHLERILSTEVGKCSTPGCSERVTLYGFAFQQCPKGHFKTIELYDEYKKMVGLGDTIVASLAIIGGVALAAELLGSQGPK